MALNGVRADGDDQQWKAEVERQLAILARENVILRSQVLNLNQSA